MPEIIELPFDYSTIALSEEDEFRTRSPGLHLTDITKDILLTAGIQRFKSSPNEDPLKRKMQFEKGFLWERMIQHILQAQMALDIKASGGGLIRPGEYTWENIIATPDAVDISAWHLEEWKATAISPKNLNKDTLRYEKPEWLWAAGWHIEYFKMESVVFRIWHHTTFEPTVKQYKVSFTPAELRDNKEKLLNHARARRFL